MPDNGQRPNRARPGRIGLACNLRRGRQGCRPEASVWVGSGDSTDAARRNRLAACPETSALTRCPAEDAHSQGTRRRVHARRRPPHLQRQTQAPPGGPSSPAIGCTGDRHQRGNELDNALGRDCREASSVGRLTAREAEIGMTHKAGQYPSVFVCLAARQTDLVGYSAQESCPTLSITARSDLSPKVPASRSKVGRHGSPRMANGDSWPG